ncbi:phage GP46 family protein [Pseudogulbenkiania sp. MAI-1]|uniref:phage GP46 family protein n=1 Tax=Pseudogulbenkiania sp. MAI-1 TaxID=990370 RepID=UPI0004A4587E|nr:phage GP46 family protein [Pseudogulbenkiania sp. MAI-1]
MSTRLLIDLAEPLPLELFADPIDAAIVLSLFCDARALPQDQQGDPRGWWGDALASQSGDRWGGRLWLLARRAKNVPETLRLAEDYTREALQWLLDDQVASAIDVTASALSSEAMKLAITIDDKTLEVRYAH